jgi:hypothetical protein
MVWGKHTNSPFYGVIIDVHSGSIGIAIVSSDPSKRAPDILYSHREFIKIFETPDTASMIRALRHALFAATLEFSQEGMKVLQSHDPRARINKVLFVCGAPWAHTATRLIHLQEKEKFTITEEKIGALIKAAEQRDEEEYRSSELLKELNVTLVEHAIVNTSVNGYPTHDPYGTVGTELSLAHISGLIPQAIIDAVSDIEEKIVTHAVRTTHTFALILFCVLRDLYPHTKNALIIDISGESTEIAIMQDEVLLEAKVFPWGGNTFVRELAKSLKTFPDEALAHIRGHSETTPEAIRLAISTIGERYTSAFTDALADLGERYIIPKRIYLLGSRKMDHFFEKLITHIMQTMPGNKSAVTLINDDLLKKTTESTESEDVFITLEARFFHKLHGCGDIS